MTRQRIQRSDREWRELLSEEEYRVGVKEGTERAFTPGNLNDEKRSGLYHCKGCGTPLWSSEHKFDSGTGWPSFWQPAEPGVIDTKTDFKLVLPRTECHCAICGLHMGH
ncbi:MAG: peptide-methionine (R)-S-oxide reductase, partial [Hyphomonas sp.]|nr:peptide-methionine (R)-S-oxide reductase [Hyphomonas sp.]